ncbi:MAG: YggT family protein [Dethiobacteria bacterium]|jgi:YggT family protein
MLRDMVSALFDIFYYLILIRIILSFFPVSPYANPTLANIIYFLRQLTEPFLAPFRKIVPPLRMGLDLSPILALIVLRLIRNFLLTIL